VKDSVIPKLLAIDMGLTAFRNVRFRNLARLVGFKDDKLKKAQSDY